MNDDEEEIDLTQDTNDDEIKNKKEQKKLDRQQEGKAKKEIRKQAEKYVEQAGKKAGRKAKATLFKSVKGLGIFGAFFAVFIIIILVIGIISFILTMPGITQQKIDEAVSGVIDGIVSVFTGNDDAIDVSKLKSKTVDALNTLNDMGLDPVGLGFVRQVFVSNSNSTDGEDTNNKTDQNDSNQQQNTEEKSKIYDYAKDANVYLNPLKIDKSGDFSEDNLVVDKIPSASPLEEYIWSNQKTYLPSTYHIKNDGNGYGKIGILLGALNPIGLGIIENVRTTFNDGLINIYKEVLAENSDSNLKLKIDFNNRTLTGESYNFDNGSVYNQSFSINLESWIGRYGKSLELLEALHIATMTSGLPEELINNKDLQTKVNISNRVGNYNINYNIKMKNSDGSTTELPIKFGSKNDNINKNIILDENNNYKESTGIGKEDITITSLYKLINQLESQVSTSTDDAQEGVSEYEEYMRNSINTFLNSKTQFYTKYDIGCYDVYEKALFAYLEGITNGQKFTYESTTPFYHSSSNSNILVGKDTIKYTIVTGNDNNNENTKTNTNLNSLNYYTKNASDLTIGQIDAITAMLMQIDRYFQEKQIVNSNNKFKDVTVNFSNNTFITSEETYDIYKSNGIKYNVYSENSTQPETLFYYTEKWLKLRDNNNINNETISELYEELSKDLATINNENNKIQAIIDSILNDSRLFGESEQRVTISVEDIKNIYTEIVAYSANVEDMKFSLPVIISVKNHWFKDLDFSDAYKSSNVVTPTTAFENNSIIVEAQLSGNGRTQTQQPYVIKGNVVTLDGEVVDDYEIKGDFGNGYEATKKIFTNGYYYVYDGTHNTANGIYLNELLENVKKGHVVEVSVRNGSIMLITAITDKEIENSVKENGKKMENSECVILENKEKSAQGNTNEQEEYTQTTKFYYIYFGEKINYISAAQSIEGAEESKEKINEVLTSIGVTHLRQPISFDRTTENGDIAATTAFAILEGMKTESSQYIYRDLKEFLIELGYYTKAEFEYLNTNVLTWFIPEYIPENAKHWQNSKPEDAINFGAVLYPATDNENTTEGGTEGGNETEESESTEGTEGSEETKDNSNVPVGFAEGLEVIAPGNCRIIDYDKSLGTITLEFDGISQPEIGILNGYTMNIKGIKIADKLVKTAGKSEEEIQTTDGINIETAKTNKTIIEAGTVIGYTKTENIYIILKNANGAYLSNVEDYMAPKTTANNMVMLDVAEEEVIEMIWQFEGTSDADGNPNDDYYEVEYPPTDVPTVGHGVTAATVETWEQLGYYGYISNGRFVQNRIPKEIVDNVSKVEVKKTLDYLDSLLEKNGVTWGGNQRAAWVSLYYNGWHNIVESIIVDYANKDMASVRRKWLEVCVMESFKEGHQNRRAQEWVLFNTGELKSQNEAWTMCYGTGEY